MHFISKEIIVFLIATTLSHDTTFFTDNGVRKLAINAIAQSPTLNPLATKKCFGVAVNGKKCGDGKCNLSMAHKCSNKDNYFLRG